MYNEIRPENSKYPCLCESLRTVLTWTRYFGLLPIRPIRKRKHKRLSQCEFEISTVSVYFSRTIQFLILVYILTIHSLAILCGPRHRKFADWYMSLFGHLIVDFDTLTTIVLSCLLAKKCCHILKKLSTLETPVHDAQNLPRNMRISLAWFFCTALMRLASYLYLCFLDFTRYKITSDVCEIIDSWAVFMVRASAGVTYPYLQLVVVYMLCSILSSKYRFLKMQTKIHINQISSSLETQNDAFVAMKEISQQWRSKYVLKFMKLEDMYHQINQCHNEINDFIGFQTLSSFSSSLYCTVYYLFRFSTSNKAGFVSTTTERGHYIGGLLHIMAKVFLYMIVGRKLLQHSQQPVKELRKLRTIHLPLEIQQQVQTLLLKWNQKGYLSACGVVNIGPWLLAPIIGNVVTYLLVALQFTPEVKSSNGTALILN